MSATNRIKQYFDEVNTSKGPDWAPVSLEEKQIFANEMAQFSIHILRITMGDAGEVGSRVVHDPACMLGSMEVVCLMLCHNSECWIANKGGRFLETYALTYSTALSLIANGLVAVRKM